MTIRVQTPYATLSFPHLFTPRPRAEGTKPVYSCSLLFDEASQASPEYKKMQTAVVDTAKEKFGPTVAMKSLVLPFRDAGEKEYKGYLPGMTYINCSRDPAMFGPVGIVNQRLQQVLDPNEIYPGLIVRALLEPFAWANTGRKGVSFGLVHIQIVKKGERIDGRLPPEQAFSAIEEDDDELAGAPF